MNELPLLSLPVKTEANTAECTLRHHLPTSWINGYATRNGQIEIYRAGLIVKAFLICSRLIIMTSILLSRF